MLRPYLLTPYRQPGSTSESNYNYAHKKTRVVIEQTFARWNVDSIIFMEKSVWIQIKFARLSLLVQYYITWQYSHKKKLNLKVTAKVRVDNTRGEVMRTGGGPNAAGEVEDEDALTLAADKELSTSAKESISDVGRHSSI